MGAKHHRDRPEQLSLRFEPKLPLERGSSGRSLREGRFSGQPLDLRMNTSEVLRVVGVHRSTLYRWTRAGFFPVKHPAGGWLRSDIESWLSQRAPYTDVNQSAAASPRRTLDEPRGVGTN
jgi:predicted DNA-binding transcriptional regulator AlpA